MSSVTAFAAAPFPERADDVSDSITAPSGVKRRSCTTRRSVVAPWPGIVVQRCCAAGLAFPLHREADEAVVPHRKVADGVLRQVRKLDLVEEGAVR